MTDEEQPGHRRPRRSVDDGDGEAGSDPRRRYFSETAADRSTTRHRRRRGPGDPHTTGSIPLVRVNEPADITPGEYRRPSSPVPPIEVRRADSAVTDTGRHTWRIEGPGERPSPERPAHEQPTQDGSAGRPLRGRRSVPAPAPAPALPAAGPSYEATGPQRPVPSPPIASQPAAPQAPAPQAPAPQSPAPRPVGRPSAAPRPAATAPAAPQRAVPRSTAPVAARPPVVPAPVAPPVPETPAAPPLRETPAAPPVSERPVAESPATESFAVESPAVEPAGPVEFFTEPHPAEDYRFADAGETAVVAIPAAVPRPPATGTPPVAENRPAVDIPVVENPAVEILAVENLAVEYSEANSAVEYSDAVEYSAVTDSPTAGIPVSEPEPTENFAAVGATGHGDAPRLAGDRTRRHRHQRRSGHKVAIALSLLLVVVLAAGGFVAYKLGVFDSRTDFSSDTGQGSVLVHIPANASLRDMGDALADAGVVGSRRAFVDAAGGAHLEAGYYGLPKGVSASAAVRMMSGTEHRVGRILVPPGVQLDTKEDVAGHVTPGIFDLIATATKVDDDGTDLGVTVDDLTAAATTASAADLGVPDWARESFDKLAGDHRRIEGLIAAETFEDVNPRLDATQVLKSLITSSAALFDSWGLHSGNHSGLEPYETLVAASIVEGEALHADDFPMVARVILNRLEKNNALEMDSTANYSATIVNLDVAGDVYKDDNPWNTYQYKGLPITPIGAVSKQALSAMENPADGDWFYFVTVDQQGTTRFSATFEQHKRNREEACKNHMVTTNC